MEPNKPNPNAGNSEAQNTGNLPRRQNAGPQPDSQAAAQRSRAPRQNPNRPGTAGRGQQSGAEPRGIAGGRRPVVGTQVPAGSGSNAAVGQPAAKGQLPKGQPGQKNQGSKVQGGKQAAAGKASGKGGGSRGGGRRRNGQAQIPNHTDLVPALDAMPVNKSVFNGAGGAQQTKRGPQAAQPERRANYTAREPKLRVIPLGGLGEVGKNMMAIEYGNDIITIDMGFMFPTPTKQPGVDYMIPDVSYLVKNKHKIRGHFLTHAHEDHMGGIPFILPQIPAPIYTARFSVGMVEKKLVEYHLQTQPQLRVLDPDKHEKVQVGAFTVELVRVTHAIPDACAVYVKTPTGTLLNTGDWRFDPSPVDNKPTDMTRLQEIAADGLSLLMSDSTSCEIPGRSRSEIEISDSLDDVFTRAQGRIIIASFSSQINRIQLVINAAHKQGRKIAFVGRSMLANVELAVKLGYIRMPAGIVTRVQDIVNLQDNQVVVMCTGSQGEDNSALSRMASGDHQNLKIKPGDTVIMSSSIIPGNERSVVGLMDGLLREGARVYHHIFREIDHVGPLHVGGHGHYEEVAQMISMMKPKYFMPIHGEFHMLVRNAMIAAKNGVSQENIFVMDNGDVLEITPTKAQKAQRVPAGVVMIDGAGVGDVEGVVLRDRLAMAGDGVFMVIATVSRKTGKLVSSPDIISRGFIYMKENEELINRARAEVRKAFERRNLSEPTDWPKFKLKLRDEIGDLLYSKTKRSPMILPVVNEV